ncbi:hypothetical protein PYS58_12170 [Chryseobacterium indologenes]|uniref:hypothetical protein n=1 Tax=Chryseobacterium indologenes TaxID=253 RepID=UPI0023E7ED13|nr:hypothetical protein [Chryseobacterium indologenes]WET47343.1 hypothetical protein PYS58_12170 [Chryseobacterium indologenes]
MKTKIVLLLLIGWVGIMFGQVKLLLSDYESKSKYINLSKAKTPTDFINKLDKEENKDEIITFIKKNTGLKDILKDSIKNQKLKYQQIYLVGGKPLYINLNNQSSFVINGLEGKKIYFYPKKSLFLIDTVQDAKLLMETTLYSIKYNCGEIEKLPAKAIHDSVFASDMKTLKNAIILNSSDNVTNNNAIAFTSGNDTKLSIGANFNSGRRWFFNVSAYTSTVNSGLFYSNKSWKTDVGGTFTINKVILRESKKISPNSCDELCEKRREYYSDVLIKQYEKLNKTNYQKELDRLESDKKKIESRIEYKIEDRKEIEEYEGKIKSIKKEMKYYEKIQANPSKYINDSIIAFDKKNISVLRGGRLHWIKISFDFYNQNVGFDTAKVKKFVSADNQIKNYFRSNVNISYNFNQQDSHIFKGIKFKWVNLQFSSNIILGNLLDANIGSDMPILKTIDFETFIVDKDEKVLGKYSYLSKAFWTLQYGLQASAFITDYFGVTVFANHTFALQNMDYMDYRNRYSLQGGLIFRINDEEDVNKATFRIMAGVDNEPYHTRALKNSFMVKVSIGIPFGLFFKNKKEK